MTLGSFIEKTKDWDKNKIIVLSDGKGWCNISDIKQNDGGIVILSDEQPLFHKN